MLSNDEKACQSVTPKERERWWNENNNKKRCWRVRKAVFPSTWCFVTWFKHCNVGLYRPRLQEQRRQEGSTSFVLFPKIGALYEPVREKEATFGREPGMKEGPWSDWQSKRAAASSKASREHRIKLPEMQADGGGNIIKWRERVAKNSWTSSVPDKSPSVAGSVTWVVWRSKIKW
jgi:hypothetical protein